MKLKAAKSIVVLALLVIVGLACFTQVEGQERPKILVITGGTPSMFNPLYAFRDIEYLRNYAPILFEPLLYQLYNGSLAPCLAKSWEILDGGKRIIFHLDERAKWSDGTPLTAYDFEFTFNFTRAVGPPSGFPAVLQSVKALDEHTVEFNATQYNRRWALEWGGFAPLPAHIWSKIEDPWSYSFLDKPEEHVTTGPFIYDSYKEGEWYYFRKRADYWKTEWMPRIDGILIRVITDPTLATTSLLAGDLDCIGVGIDLLSQVIGQPNVGIWMFPVPSATEYLAINTRLYPLNISEVRKAIDLAIDKKKISQFYFMGYADLANRSLVNFKLLPKAYVPEAAWPGIGKTHEECVAEANSILDNLGFLDTNGDGIRETPDGNPLHFTYILQSMFTFRINAADEITKNLREIGIDVEVQAPSMFEAFVMVFLTPNPTFGFFQGTYGEYPDAWYCQVTNFLYPPVGLSLLSATGYNNSELDALGKAVILSQTDDDFYGNLTQHVRIFAEDLPVVPICFYQMSIYAYRTDILTNWNWDACALTGAFGYPLPQRPLTVNLLTPVGWQTTPTPTPASTGLTTEQIIVIAVVVIVIIAIVGYLAYKRKPKT